jgi:hypothetical protein
MTKRHFIPLFLLVDLIAWVGSVAAQTTRTTLELGYQWLDVSGNQDMYRSQVNEDDGFVLRNFSLTTDKPTGTGVFDRLRINAEGFGGSPQGRFSLEIGRARLYNLRVAYRRASHFSALPALANPFIGSEIVPGQHTLDRTSTNLSVEVELLPGRTITPLLGYRWYDLSGPGQTTYHVGQDEFQLSSDLEQTIHEFYGGVAVHYGGFQASLLHGWRTFDQKETLTLAAGAGQGNGSRPVLGHDVTLDSLGRTSIAEGTVPFTTASFAGVLGSQVRLAGAYVRSDHEAKLNENESYDGSLVSFQLQRFLGGFTGRVNARAEAPDWRFDTRVEADLAKNLELEIGYVSRRRALEGWSMLSGTYLQTVNYSGGDPKNLEALLRSDSAVERESKTVEATVSSRDLGPVRLWATWAKTTEDLTVSPAAAEIVVPAGQGGTFSRDLQDLSAGAMVKVSPVKISLDWRHQSAEDLILRTDFRDQNRWRLRVDVAGGSFLRVLGTAEIIEAENPRSGFLYDATTRHYALDINITPIEALTVRLGAGSSFTNSAMLVRRPQDFVVESSAYDEDGRSYDGGVTMKLGRFSFDGGYSRFSNEGSLELDLDRTYANVAVDLAGGFGVLAQYDKRDYDEKALSLASFDATRYGVFLRWQK